METKTGKIKSVQVSTGSSQKGAWTRFCFELEDGKKYSTFNEDIGKKSKPGQYVEITGEQDGKYWNMTGMRTLPEADVKPTDNDLKEDLLRQILSELKQLNEASLREPGILEKKK